MGSVDAVFWRGCVCVGLCVPVYTQQCRSTGKSLKNPEYRIFLRKNSSKKIQVCVIFREKTTTPTGAVTFGAWYTPNKVSDFGLISTPQPLPIFPPLRKQMRHGTPANFIISEYSSGREDSRDNAELNVAIRRLQETVHEGRPLQHERAQNEGNAGGRVTVSVIKTSHLTLEKWTVKSPTTPRRPVNDFTEKSRRKRATFLNARGKTRFLLTSL